MRIFLTICFLAYFGCLHAQKLDSIKNHYDSLAKSRLSPDIKMPTADSLAAVREFEAMRSGLTHKIDSLKGLDLPTERYTRKLDSLNNVGPEKYVQQAQQKITSVQDKVNKPISNIEDKINEKLSVINKETGGKSGLPGSVDLPGNIDLNKDLKLPDAKLPDAKLPDVKLPDANLDTSLKIPDVPGLKVENPVGQLKSIDELKNVQEKIGNVSEITDKAQEYGNDVKNIADGKLGEVKSIPDAIENKAKELDEIKELEKHQGLGEMDKYKDMADAAKDPEAMKELAKEQVLTYAKNHFAGKEKALQAGMEQLSKLKQKYPDMPTPEQMKKRVYNAMNGKPLIERLVPGLTFQVQKTNNILVDINPVLAFRISGVWNAGLGWNERLSFQKWNKVEPIDRIYGPRLFTSVVIARGFGVKVEGEKMNTYVPTNPITADIGGRRWVWSLFVGIKKDYRISKNLRGNVQTLYNIYDDHDNSPYTDRLSVRMGFEIPMKKKVKANSKK